MTDPEFDPHIRVHGPRIYDPRAEEQRRLVFRRRQRERTRFLWTAVTLVWLAALAALLFVDGPR